MSEAKFALVSTVDSMGEGFPSHEVFVFETENQAVLAAVEILVKHGEVSAKGEYHWTYGDDLYDDPKDLLANWQEHLESTEYFHILPIVKPENSK